ncbi:cAMP-binding domain of CRP or a regulatory subunit of cAMP-dependent protein kinases [Lentzea fradiae]|uniref:cAMP-binding domain of CRP or a regulatory subunit of cAMP-dependent protein kinases n=1 Tax=Lentzea fradiae TaxID=200378 RepID=A0A1G7M5B7_9PSEU|nr:Crp/Fnr family transcriptional regulator [Lentzea fradiae]SDF56978.1 cAMP-binding domain of CRP or a regulatory subunit of cAMP-dependent protein kinases [Lentzea fradiae]
MSTQLHAALSRIGTRTAFPRGGMIVRQHEVAVSVLYVERGICRVAHLSANGRESLLALRGAGELIGDFGVLAGRPRTAMVTAVTEVVGLVVPAARFERLAEDEPEVGRELMRRLVLRVEEANTKRVDLGTLPTRQRLARLLLELVTTYGDDVGSLLTQEELGHAIGATRESVVRALRGMREDGLVSTARRTIVVLRRDLLAAESAGS